MAPPTMLTYFQSMSDPGRRLLDQGVLDALINSLYSLQNVTPDAAAPGPMMTSAYNVFSVAGNASLPNAILGRQLTVFAGPGNVTVNAQPANTANGGLPDTIGPSDTSTVVGADSWAQFIATGPSSWTMISQPEVEPPVTVAGAARTTTTSRTR